MNLFSPSLTFLRHLRHSATPTTLNHSTFMHLCNLKIAKVRFFAFFFKKIWKNPKVRRIFAVDFKNTSPSAQMCLWFSPKEIFAKFHLATHESTIGRPLDGLRKISMKRNSRTEKHPVNVLRSKYGARVSGANIEYLMLYFSKISLRRPWDNHATVSLRSP